MLLHCCALLVILHAVTAGKPCDKACETCETPRFLPSRDCPKFGYDCGTAASAASSFNVSASPSTGCARLSCADPRARLFVDGCAHATLRCRDWRWQFGRRACDSSSHALCAKPCTYCSSAVPSYLPAAGKFTKPIITSASATRQCATATCGAASFLYGVGARGTVIDRILEDELACTGDARWRDSDGTEYDYAVCGGDTSICQGCNDLNMYPVGSQFKSYVAIGPASRSNGHACSQYHCSDGEVFVKMGSGGEIGDLTCSFDGEWKINGIKVDDAMEIACVKSQTACSRKLDAPLTKFQSPEFTSSYKYQDTPLEAKPCPDGKFYYLENEGDTISGSIDSVVAATCDALTGKWDINGNYYYQIACAKRDCKGCDDIPAAIQQDIDGTLSGYKHVTDPVKSEGSACNSYSCVAPQELAIVGDDYGSRKVKYVTCAGDGTWLIDRIRPTSQPTKVACVSDCSSCNKGVTNNTLLPPDFAIKVGSPCLVALKCPKGKFFGKATSTASYTELGFGNEAVCQTDGQWQFNGATYNSIGCSKRGADCTGNCNVFPFLGDIAESPGYKPAGVEKTEVERYDELFQRQSCAALECPPPFSLVLQTMTINIPFVAKRLKCEGNDMWFDKQDPSIKIGAAKCMTRDDNCKRNFPVEGANYSSAIIEMNGGFHMEVMECPGSSKYYYLKDKWATPTETTTEPLCRGGKWQIGDTNAEYIGCKAGCPALKTLACPTGMVCFPEDALVASNILQCAHGQLLMGETENGPVKEELSNRCLQADDPETTLGEWSKRDSYYTCAFEYSDACIQAPRPGYGIPIQIKTVASTKKTIASCSAGYELRAYNYGAMGSEAFCVYGLAMTGHQWVNSDGKFTSHLMCIKA